MKINKMKKSDIKIYINEKIAKLIFDEITNKNNDVWKILGNFISDNDRRITKEIIIDREKTNEKEECDENT